MNVLQRLYIYFGCETLSIALGCISVATLPNLDVLQLIMWGEEEHCASCEEGLHALSHFAVKHEKCRCVLRVISKCSDERFSKFIVDAATVILPDVSLITD